MTEPMTTPSTVSETGKKPRPLWSRVLIALFVLLFLLALAAGAGYLWVRHAITSSLPQIDGEIRVAGLSAPVRVVRDKHGVPHISAQNLTDLFFAQGYITAQDRLWQMDMSRRAAAGELSEILPPKLFGQGVLRIDKRQRVLGIRDVAEKAASAATGEEKQYLEAYAKGVNAFIDSHRDKLPAEFKVLRYGPKPWTVTDTYLVGAEMAEELQFYLVQHMWLREKVLAKVGPELAAELYPTTSWRDRPPTAPPPDFNEDPPELPDTESVRPARKARHRAALEQLLPEWLRDDIEGHENPLLVPGSNNWAVSGAKTATGKPLLSNDMHLSHRVPGVWYETHLTAPGFDVAGVTFAGIPAIVVGHNQRIGWGFTNVGPATYDLYIENFNEKGEYQSPNGWVTSQHRKETIHVRGDSDLVLDVPVTRHGPVISAILPGETRQLALRWTLYEPGILSMPFLDVNRAQNWDGFRKAISRFGIPSQNAVYADVDGHIGYITTGKVPTRATPSAGVPVGGADDRHEWTGFIPFEQMPTILDPPSGVIATANGRITPDGYPYQLGLEWVSSERTQRIYRFLQGERKFTSADMLKLQSDVMSAFDRFIAQRFIYAIDRTPSASDKAKQAAGILRKWNGRVDVNSPAPRIVNRAQRELIRMMLEPKLGVSPEKPQPDLPPTGWRMYRWEELNVWLETTLDRQNKAWLPPGYDSFEKLLTSAMEKAVSAKGVSSDLRDWKWGEAVALDLKHPIFHAGPGHAPQSGNGNTVKQVGSDFGPSQRLTVDFADLDQTNLNITTGESGNIYSPYFMDHWPAWYNGTTFRLPFNAAAVEEDKAHVLTLQP